MLLDRVSTCNKNFCSDSICLVTVWRMYGILNDLPKKGVRNSAGMVLYSTLWESAHTGVGPTSSLKYVDSAQTISMKGRDTWEEDKIWECTGNETKTFPPSGF